MSTVDGHSHRPEQSPASDASSLGAPGPPAVPEPVEPAVGEQVSGLPPALRRRVSKKVVRLSVLLLLVVGVVVAWRMIDGSVYSPSKPVEQYLSALSRGDAAAALAMVEDLDLSPAEQKTMTNAVYGKASNRPTDVEVTDVDRHGSQATVAVRYKQGGAVITQEFAVTRTGSRDVVFSEWAIEYPKFASLSVGSSARWDSANMDYPSTALVNGVECPLTGYSSELHLLPGTYAISAPDAGEYLEANTFTVTVGGDAEPPLGVDQWLGYRLSDSGKKAAVDRAREWLDACQKATPAVPEGCPFETVGESLADFTWTLTK